MNSPNTHSVYYGTVCRAVSALFAVVIVGASRGLPLFAQDAAPTQIRIELAPSQEHYRDRISRAAAESLTQLSAWLGSYPHSILTVRGGAAPQDSGAANGAIGVRLPWLSAPSTMDVERDVAYAIAMQYWPHAAESATIARGLGAYLQTRITERLFNVAYARPGYRTERLQLFGGYLPFAIPALRVDRWSLVDEGREARAFAALERYLSWPVLQGALKVLATTARGAPLTRDRMVTVVSGAAGQDLTSFFDVAFDPAADVDYAVADVTSSPVPEPCSVAGCARTRVVVTRRGNASFRYLALQVLFMDGQQATAAWDGRASEHTFEFESPAPARAARLDPEGVLLLDDTRLDHMRYVSPEINLPMAKWASRWLVWLQDALLTYTAVL